MKWFKHYSNAHTNQFIQAMLQEKNGHELYASWFLLLELLCLEFKKDTTVFRVSLAQIKNALHVNYDSKVSRIVQELGEFASRFDQDLLNVEEISKKFYKIQTPIILELIGKEFKRTRQCSGSSTPKKKEERIKNKKKEKKAAKPPIVSHNHLLFVPAEMLEWLGATTGYMQKKWTQNYSEGLIIQELDKAMNYYANAPSSRKWKSKSSGFDNWLKKVEPDKKECEFFSYLKDLEANGERLRDEQFAKSEKERRAHCQLVK